MRKNIALFTISLLLLSSLVMPVIGQQTKQPQQQQKKSPEKPANTLIGQKSKRPQSEESETVPERDADMNLRSGATPSNEARAEYLRDREEMIAMLRGLPMPESFPADARARAIRQMEQQEVELRLRRLQGSNGQVGPQINSTSWTQIGPAPIPDGQTTGTTSPVSGRVLSIAVHPTNPNIVYVGTAQGGLYRSLDGGQTWVALMDSALSLVIGAIAIDPNNPSTLFIGTGEGNLCGDCFYGVGLYRLRNADTNPIIEGPFNTATNTSTGALSSFRSITKILVSPSDSNTIFVGTSSGTAGIHGVITQVLAPGQTQMGLFRSTNAQAATPNFTKLNVGGATGSGTNPGVNSPARDIEFEPGNPNNLLVGFVDLNTFNTSGVYRSTNALAADPTTVTFTRTLVSPAAQQAFNIQLAVSQLAGVTTVYAALDELDSACPTCDYGAVKKSIDGGVTWTPAYLTGASGFCGGQCFYDMPIAVDPNNPQIVMVGGAGDYDALLTPNKRSVDGGATWIKASVGLHPDSHDIVFAPSNTLIAYHGNDGGIWRSNDGGATWNSLNNTGFSATQFVDLSTHPTDRNFMIGGTQDNGTPFLQPNNTWKLGDFGDGGYSLIDQNATDTTNVTAYHTYFNGTNSQVGFSRANSSAEIDPNTGWPTFHGCQGTSSNNGITCSDAVLFYAPMAQGPGNPNTIYFGTQRLNRSADRGNTMPAVSQQFAGTGGRISAIGISPQSDNARAVGTVNGQLFGTTTGANPLTNLDASNQVPNSLITRVVFDPNDNTVPYTAYAVVGNYLGTGHVWKTTNLDNTGTTWTNASSGLPDVPHNAFAIDPQNSNNLYVGTDIGVYRSTNGGTSWQPFSEGLPRVAVFDMEFQARSNPSIRVLRIATHGRGIWQIAIDPVQKKRGDFDTDGKTDIATWNSATRQWFIYNSMGGFTRIEPDWGAAASGDIAVPRDYDGDNKVDVAVFRPSEGNWYILLSGKNTVTRTPDVRGWGTAGDIPVPGDYDGDGKTDLAVWRPSEGNWYILNSSNNTVTVRGWGATGDKLVPADYDKDGKTDIAVYRPSEGNWYIINSGSNTVTVKLWGAAGDKPVQADYDGDGKDDIAVFRPSEGNWYIINSNDNSVTVKGWGASTDVPVPGDYDGDGKNDLAVYRPSDGNWYIIESNTNTVRVQNLGGDQPVPATYLPQ
jgi:photosystem II stability/assembly factor-like uncharacterized protein